jgi:hypothetical protein
MWFFRHQWAKSELSGSWNSHWDPNMYFLQIHRWQYLVWLDDISIVVICPVLLGIGVNLALPILDWSVAFLNSIIDSRSWSHSRVFSWVEQHLTLDDMLML